MCFQFAQKNGLVPAEEVARFEQGQKIKEKIKTSGGPGGCKEEGQCRNYCGDAGHVEECIAFASASGGLSPEEARSKLQEFSKQIKQFDQPNDNQMIPLDGKMNPLENDATRLEQFKKFEEQFKNNAERQQFMKERIQPTDSEKNMMPQNMTPQMQDQMRNMSQDMQKNDQDKMRMPYQQQQMPQGMTSQMQEQMKQIQQQMPQNMPSMQSMPSMPQSNNNFEPPFSASILDAFHYLVR